MFGAASGKKLKAVVVPPTPNQNVPVSNGGGNTIGTTNNDIATV